MLILVLTLNVLCISESCTEIKIKVKFYFFLLFSYSKGFMKAFKAFIKPFEAPQRSMKIKIYLIFFSSSRIRTGRVKISNNNKYTWLTGINLVI